MKSSSGNKILASGFIKLPESPTFVPSECYCTPDPRYFVVSTFSVQDRAKSGPLFSFRWNSVTQNLELEEQVLGHLLRSEHARNLNFSSDGKLAILTDHGADIPPFPGGYSKLFRKTMNDWELSDLFSERFFHFDVAISDRLLAERYLVFMSNLSRSDNTLVAIDRAGNVTNMNHAWPADLHFSNVLTGLFVDVDGDGQEELVIGGRWESKRDIVLRWNGDRFERDKIEFPLKQQQPHWETVQLMALDMNKSGKPSIITLNHDQKIQQGSLEVYLNRGGTFERMSLDPELDNLYATPNRWLHRVQVLDIGNGYPSLAFTVRKADFTKKNTQSPIFFALNESGERLEMGKYDLFPEEEYIFATSVQDFNNDGKPELLVINFDGHWKLATINPFV